MKNCVKETVGGSTTNYVTTEIILPEVVKAETKAITGALALASSGAVAMTAAFISLH